ncbi:hypothetical protein [Streptomyces sp. 11x1]|nr:hypothetical protein [Streptomyces sp. 11x1]WNZ12063.1 hypothetical protein P8T65_33930 [Streptomyces sp. 11x1]
MPTCAWFAEEERDGLVFRCARVPFRRVSLALPDGFRFQENFVAPDRP